MTISDSTNTSEKTDTSMVKSKRSRIYRKSRTSKSDDATGASSVHCKGDDDDMSSISRIKASIKSKTKTDSNKYMDKTAISPMTRLRAKKYVPEIVSRDKLDLEKGFMRDKWLRMSGAELGAACLDHLYEMERQRHLCGNLSGRTSGMLKDCNATAVNIIGALVEKLESNGDSTYLKSQNLQLRDLTEARRKIERQEKEITDLRNATISLEIEVNALKEGREPYVQSTDMPKGKGKRKNKSHTYDIPGSSRNRKNITYE